MTTTGAAGRAFDPSHVLSALEVGVACVARDWRVLYVNDAWATLAGDASPAACIGRELWDVCAALAGTAAGDMVRATHADGLPRALRVDRGGATAMALDVGVRWSGADGTLVCTLRDATEHARLVAEVRTLAEQSAESERLRELARAMAAERDAAALLEQLCAAAIALCRATGATVTEIDEDAHGTVVAVSNHPSDARGHRFALAGTLTGALLTAAATGTPGPVVRVPTPPARDDDTGVTEYADGRAVGARMLAVLAAHGTPVGVLAISRPVSEPAFDARDEARLRVIADHAALALWKARLVDEARAANETKSGFLATVSHELRTPLTALTGYGELVADEILGPLTPAQADVMERMRAVTHQLTAMIEEILTFSALEAGRELVRPVPVDVDEVIQAVVAVVEPLADHKTLTFAAVVPRQRPPLVTDPDKLRQILVNLCGNAIKFTDRGGVRLVVATQPREITFAVADSGVGIAAADLPRLFQAFAQLDSGLTRRYGGTGLGLHISQRLARLLGGRIDVDSRVGEGSTFTLALPLRAG